MIKGQERTRLHFDRIADNYYEEIPSYVRDHLANKWWGLVSCHFAGHPQVVDIGCGDGTNMMFLKRKGISVVGVELSSNMVRRGREKYPELGDSISEGSALNLTFADGTFDIAVMTGVLHHIYSREHQHNAVHEALRVVKAKGVVIIRECNLINPAFRLFWNYIFPLTAKIDRFGGENWIPAKVLQEVFGKAVQDTHYFTFIPSFTPQRLIPYASRVERMLEESVLKILSAHYVVVIGKSDGRSVESSAQ